MRLTWGGLCSIPVLICVVLIWFNFGLPPATAAEPIKVITASATSSAADASPVVDLLDLTKKARWRPETQDYGEDEGLFFQFQDPVLLDWIEVKLKASKAFRLGFYLDGQRSLAKNPSGAEGDNDLWYNIQARSEGGYVFVTLGAFTESGGLNTKVKSVFIKYEYLAGQCPEVIAVRFYRGSKKTPLAVTVPSNVNGSITATSILAPETAYSPVNLFDSRPDFAWATDGKKTDGIGAGFTIKLDKPQTLAGLMIWNGYQRSETHYKANARPAELKVKIDESTEFTLPVKDIMGSQILTFPAPVAGATTLTVTVAKLYAGTAYKDLVVSELRLIDDKGRCILLNASPPRPQVENPLLQKMLDRTYSPLLMGINTDYYPSRRLRIRANGSFVAYESGTVLEGNWEPIEGGVRLFGKKYLTNPRDSEYLQAVKEKTAVKIFQAGVSIIDPTTLSYEQAKQYFKPILAERGYYTYIKQPNRPKTLDWWLASDDHTKISGKTEEELMRQAYDKALAQKALLLSSPLFTDFLIQTDKAKYYSVYDEGE
ncbi:MAG: hypothetical protein K6U03_04725 [Firmicutes bacterium]|nr:hypothetical protein [Bacillota bacterium]